MGDSPNCFFFWGRFSEFCKLVGLIILAIITTPFVLITPFYILAHYVYSSIPVQYRVFKEECRKKREEKASKLNK